MAPALPLGYPGTDSESAPNTHPLFRVFVFVQRLCTAVSNSCHITCSNIILAFNRILSRDFHKVIETFRKTKQTKGRIYVFGADSESVPG